MTYDDHDLDLHREYQEHRDTVSNFREHLSALANRMLEASPELAGELLVLDRRIYRATSHGTFMLFDSLKAERPEPEAEPAKHAKGRRAPKGQGAHRHKFNAAGACACGATRQRAPKGSGEPQSAEARTLPLGTAAPAGRRPIGDHAPDDFDGGTMGSSSARER